MTLLKKKRNSFAQLKGFVCIPLFDLKITLYGDKEKLEKSISNPIATNLMTIQFNRTAD